MVMSLSECKLNLLHHNVSTPLQAFLLVKVTAHLLGLVKAHSSMSHVYC